MRIIALEQLHNTRDLGGLPGSDGSTVRRGRLIRSGELFSASPADLAALAALPLCAVADFRCAEERRETPDPCFPGAQSHWFPILKAKTLGITREEGQDLRETLTRLLSSPTFHAGEYLTGLYRAILQDPEALLEYRRFFGLLLQDHSGAVLWHCSAGKDRAGVGTALLLTALGTPREAIFQDYLLTNACLAGPIERDALRLFPEESTVQAAYRGMMQVKADYLQAVFRAMDEAGGPARFLADRLGLAQPQIARLRKLYLTARGN